MIVHKFKPPQYSIQPAILSECNTIVLELLGPHGDSRYTFAGSLIPDEIWTNSDIVKNVYTANGNFVGYEILQDGVYIIEFGSWPVVNTPSIGVNTTPYIEVYRNVEQFTADINNIWWTYGGTTTSNPLKSNTDTCAKHLYAGNVLTFGHAFRNSTSSEAFINTYAFKLSLAKLPEVHEY